MPSLTRRLLFVSGAFASAVVLAPSCRDPEEIIVDLTTNVPCDAVGEVAVAVASTPLYADTDLASPYGPVTRSSVCHDGVLGRLVVAKSAAAQAAIVAVLAYKNGATARECMNGKSDDCVFARRRVKFVRGAALPLRVALIAECKGVACDVLTTCRDAGRICYDAEVTCATDGCSEPGSLSPPSDDSGTGTPDASASDAADGNDGASLTDGASSGDGGQTTTAIQCGSGGLCVSPPTDCCLRPTNSACLPSGACNKPMELLLRCRRSAECPMSAPYCQFHQDNGGFAYTYCSSFLTSDLILCAAALDCTARPGSMACSPRPTSDPMVILGLCQPI